MHYSQRRVTKFVRGNNHHPYRLSTPQRKTAVIAKEIPDMDIVGFAPKSRGAHTTKEHLFVETVEPFWQMLTALLERLCSEPV